MSDKPYILRSYPLCPQVFLFIFRFASLPLSDTFQYQFSFFASASSFLHFSHSVPLSLSPSFSVTHRTLIPFGFDFFLQAFVRFSARRMDTTAEASATARMAGRERSATSRSGSARCPIAPAMDAASRASVAASAAGRDPTAINVSVKPEKTDCGWGGGADACSSRRCPFSTVSV